MNFRFAFLFLLSILFLTPASNAQSIDYLKHNKIFYLCSFKRECSQCYNCEHGRFLVRLENRLDKKINKISYKYYSEPQNRVVEKVAKIEGKVIDPKHIGLFYICVPEGAHWIVSDIDYTDGTSNIFTLKDRLETFIQEPDECDCNN
jgi:hypothetical protein